MIHRMSEILFNIVCSETFAYEKGKEHMKKELQCPVIYKNQKMVGYGGNQEWFLGEFQRKAGCGSVTGSNIAAIYAGMNEDMKGLYNPENNFYSYEEYLKLMETMYGYMKPGFMGYPLIGRFAKDFVKYAKDCGISLASRQMFLPKEKEKALHFICQGIDQNHPIAFLILRHPAKEFREDNWHWVTITGYNGEKKKIIWSNCGEREEIDWNMLFDSSKKYYVGMVRFEKEFKK